MCGQPVILMTVVKSAASQFYVRRYSNIYAKCISYSLYLWQKKTQKTFGCCKKKEKRLSHYV